MMPRRIKAFCILCLGAVLGAFAAWICQEGLIGKRDHRWMQMDMGTASNDLLQHIGDAMNSYCSNNGGYLPVVTHSREWVNYLVPVYIKRDSPLLLDLCAGREAREEREHGTPFERGYTTSFLFNLSVSGKKLADLGGEDVILTSDRWYSPEAGYQMLDGTLVSRRSARADIPPVLISLEPIKTSAVPPGD